jgi:Neisseria meningitidis TspB protein.
MWKRSVLSGVALFALGGHAVFAQSNGELGYQQMQQAITGTVDSWAQSQGYSLSDPRVYNTLVAVGAVAGATVLTTNVGSGLLLAGSAPAWGTVLGVAALAAGAGAIYLAGDKLYSWAFSGSKSSPAIAVTAPSSGSAAAGIIYTGTSSYPPMSTIVSASINADLQVVTYSAPYYYTSHWMSTTVFSNPNASLYTTHQTYTLASTLYYVWSSSGVQGTTPCPSGYSLSNGQCVSSGGGASTTTGQTLPQAVAALSSGELSQPLSTDAVGKVTDYLLSQAASQAGYNGIPYTAATPVSGANAASAETAMGTTWPSVAAITTAVPIGGFVPATSATGADTPVSASSVVVTSTSPCVADPNVAGCADLGSAPASSAVATNSYAVSLTAWNVGPASGTCPADITVSILGSDYALSYGPLCRLATGCQPVVVALCALAAALIVVAGVRS